MGGSGIAFSPDDRLIAIAGIDGRLRVYELSTGRSTATIRRHSSLQDLDFSPDGKLIAAANLDGDVLIWNEAGRALERTIHHGDALIAVRFSPDGRTIATGDLSGNVDFWDVQSGRHVGRTLGGHNALVIGVSYDPRGTELATTSGDGQIRLWDLASGKLIGAPLPGADAAGSGTFFPDGKHVIAVFGSGTGVVWNVDPAAWRRQACRIAHRNLTRSEWRDLLPRRGYRDVCP